MDKFKKGDKVQVRTSPRVYTVTENETKQGRLHVTRGDRTYIFRTNEDDVNLWNGIEEDNA